MHVRSLSHLSNEALKLDLHAAVGRERTSTAEVLEFLAEFDSRRLFVPAAFASMHEYCVEVLHLSEDATKKRLQAAQVARRLPAVLAAVADGRLHLSAVVILATRLTPDNVDSLIAAATHKSKSQIEFVLAETFPRPDVPASIRVVESGTPAPSLSDAIAISSAPGHSMSLRCMLRCAGLLLGARGPAPGHVPRPLTSASSSGSLSLKGVSTVLAAPPSRLAASHAPGPDLASRAVGEVIRSGTVPAAGRREVMTRDGRQCTFVSASGRRCSACRKLDLDHIVPVAKVGETTADNLRLLCPVHNQHEADRVYGAGFMAEKRAEGRARGSSKRGARADAASALAEHSTRTSSALGHSQDREHVDEVVPYLLALKYRKDEARQGAELCAPMRGAPLEARVKFALQGLGRERFQLPTLSRTPAG